MLATEILRDELVLTDVDYVVSDIHINYQNIIEYCQSETFAPTEERLDDMNWTLLANWNRTVDPDDKVVFVGDFAWLRGSDQVTQRKIDNLWDTLNGQKVFVRGDHDYVVPSAVDDWRYAVAIEHDGESYFVSHFSGDTPESLPDGECQTRSNTNSHPTTLKGSRGGVSMAITTTIGPRNTRSSIQTVESSIVLSN